MPNAQEVLEWIKWDKERKANMTNEEYIRQCNTEQLAEFFDRLAYSLYTNQNRMTCEDDWKRWLKEKHTE